MTNLEDRAKEIVDWWFNGDCNNSSILQKRITESLKSIRNETLEETAWMVEEFGHDRHSVQKKIAQAIRSKIGGK